jgi:hypothetical protein
MFRSLTLTDPTCIPTDFQSPIWRKVSMITPRHSVRNQWNDAAVTRHCQQTGSQLFICPASDTINKRSMTMVERYIAAKSGTTRNGSQDRRDKNGLPDRVPLAVGMDIIVTMNVEVDLDIATGTRGTIVGIMLDPHEPTIDTQSPTVKLTYMPTYILVKLATSRGIRLPGLDSGVVPIVPASKAYQFTMLTMQRDRSITKFTNMSDDSNSPSCLPMRLPITGLKVRQSNRLLWILQRRRREGPSACSIYTWHYHGFPDEPPSEYYVISTWSY